MVKEVECILCGDYPIATKRRSSKSKIAFFSSHVSSKVRSGVFWKLINVVFSLHCKLLVHTFRTNSITKRVVDWQPFWQLVCNLLLMKADERYIKHKKAKSLPN